MPVTIIEVTAVLEGEGVLLTLLLLEQFWTPQNVTNITCKVNE